MARKGNRQKNGVDYHMPKPKKKGPDSVPSIKGQGKASEAKIFPKEQLPNGNQSDGPLTESARRTHHSGEEDIYEQNHEISLETENHVVDSSDQSILSGFNTTDFTENKLGTEISGIAEENGTASGSNFGLKQIRSLLSSLLNTMRTKSPTENIELAYNEALKNLRVSFASISKEVTQWLERQRPFIVFLTTMACKACDHVKVKIQQVYPIVLKWLMHFGSIILLLSLVWLDCTLQGIDSFLRMGTTSFFSIVWCSILSVIAMAGMSKFLIALAVSALTAVFLGFTLGTLVLALSGSVLLWLYGSFWITVLFIFLGGMTFMFRHERIALFILTTYSVYCAWGYVGWLGLLLAFNLSFISRDGLIYFLNKNLNQQHRTHGPTESMTGASFENEPGLSGDCGPGVASTSGTDSELTSEDEVARLLSCTDHYSVLGLARYQNVDVSYLKREYKKKAMLVHPDKNMGNEKAAEAFKKLQNAYEVLLDSTNQKAYDDELRREELLNCFRRFQSASQKNGGHGGFPSGFTPSEADGEDPFRNSRQIACKKCGNFHRWVQTKKSKSQARWCQDCKDFHQAKDGDGWVEQSSQPVFFGLFQKVDAPTAYVCADSKIYDATEWYICQGMRCPANTHKPSFHVNTSVTSKHHTSGRGSGSGLRGGRVPTSNGTDETMTEEEFLEWLQNAVQAGMFDNFSDSQSSRSENGSGTGSSHTGSGGGSSSSSSSSKRKKKGKKQW